MSDIGPIKKDPMPVMLNSTGNYTESETFFLSKALRINSLEEEWPRDKGNDKI